VRDPTPPSPEQRLTDMFTAHHDQVVAYVARRTRPLGDQAQAQDVTAEVFAVAWRRLSRAEGVAPADVPDPALPWLLVTARHVLSQRVRDDARRAAREERVTTDRALAGARGGSTTSDPGHALALAEQVAAALDRLSPDDRELLLLRVWDELSFTGVAQVLGCSPGAARVRWLRARRRFAAALTREELDHPPPLAGAIPLPMTATTAGDPR
jgi:RNA polymerase sigma-70 factor, ECF subfamily